MNDQHPPAPKPTSGAMPPSAATMPRPLSKRTLDAEWETLSPAKKMVLITEAISQRPGEARLLTINLHQEHVEAATKAGQTLREWIGSVWEVILRNVSRRHGPVEYVLYMEPNFSVKRPGPRSRAVRADRPADLHGVVLLHGQDQERHLMEQIYRHMGQRIGFTAFAKGRGAGSKNGVHLQAPNDERGGLLGWLANYIVKRDRHVAGQKLVTGGRSALFRSRSIHRDARHRFDQSVQTKGLSATDQRLAAMVADLQENSLDYGVITKAPYLVPPEPGAGTTPTVEFYPEPDAFVRLARKVVYKMTLEELNEIAREASSRGIPFFFNEHKPSLIVALARMLRHDHGNSAG